MPDIWGYLSENNERFFSVSDSYQQSSSGNAIQSYFLWDSAFSSKILRTAESPWRGMEQ